ncbi:Cupredoxin [Paraphoma chrysanthemicola]|uniref:Cupredoxin n=1 Tax=Paraphoma chrysanthemicola TaxID=798071 RepID=A0A8K0R2G4_9PLEO|nr:Cupredoxin [Paraphoma chrysanthemicola]
MYFSRSIMVSALMGFAAATTHSVAASESLLASATGSAAGSLSTGSSTGSPSAEGMVATHIVQVGGPNGSLAFYPNNVVAQPGDLVQFQFHPKNHSVVQSTFDQPCVPIQNVMANKTDAFFSGFMPTNASLGATANVLTYTIRVKDTKPVWFYCSQGKHCQAGMVGAVNAPPSGNKTMQAFIALAANAAENLSPGQAGGSQAGNTPPSPSGTSPTGTTGGNTPQSPSGSSPAQQSANVAAGISSQSLLGLGAAAVAAFAML